MLPLIANLDVAAVDAEALSAAFPELNLDEQLHRQDDGHQPYLARLGGVSVAYGWSAHRAAVIGELGIKLQLAAGERYLWDFVTLPDFRGQGIYAGMLQAILATEADAQRLWIGHDFGNVASARGILKAGFQPVNALYREADGRFVLYAYPEVEGRPTVLERAAAGAVVLGLSLAGQLTTSPS
jgi:GNAT superfamily N-acetyltransferase